MDTQPPTNSAVEVLRLDILMQYYRRLRSGTAALLWHDPLQGGPPIQAHLVALLYGHILRAHPATREELFMRVGELAQRSLRSKGASGFVFAPWCLHGPQPGEELTLWPWLIVPREQLTAATFCSAILRLGEPSAAAPAGRWIELELAHGQESDPVRVPSSALIAIAGLSQTCKPPTRYLLARLLYQMNHFWGSPAMTVFYSEAVAYAHAVSVIREGPLRLP